MYQGKVKWYNELKGFGFIKSNSGDDLFVHRSGLISPFSGLATDQMVDFEIKHGDRGMVAFNVQ